MTLWYCYYCGLPLERKRKPPCPPAYAPVTAPLLHRRTASGMYSVCRQTYDDDEDDGSNERPDDTTVYLQPAPTRPHVHTLERNSESARTSVPMTNVQLKRPVFLIFHPYSISQTSATIRQHGWIWECSDWSAEQLGSLRI